MKTIAIAALLSPLFGTISTARAAAPAPAGAADREADLGRQWKERLGLGAEQLPKFLSAVKAKDADLQPLRERRREQMRQLQIQLTAGAPDKEVQETLDKLDEARILIAQRDARFDGGLTTLLTPTQRAKYLVWKSLGAFPGSLAAGADAGSLPETPADSEAEPE